MNQNPGHQTGFFSSKEKDILRKLPTTAQRLPPSIYDRGFLLSVCSLRKANANYFAE